MNHLLFKQSVSLITYRTEEVILPLFVGWLVCMSNVFFFKIQKRDFLRFLLCCIRFLEHWLRLGLGCKNILKRSSGRHELCTLSSAQPLQFHIDLADLR